MAATLQKTTTVYDIDPARSSAEFRVKHLMIATVAGRIAVKGGTIVSDALDPRRSTVEAELDVASINTGVAQRDDHLRSADFFDAANHPTISFQSAVVTGEGDVARDSARSDAPQRVVKGSITGDLTIRGVTRRVTLTGTKDGEATDPWGNRRAAFTATTTIDRKDFGLTWNQALETGGVVVGDKVKVSLHVQGIERKEG